MWLRLTPINGGSIVVSLKNVCEFYGAGGYTTIQYIGGPSTDVRETVDEIWVALTAMNVSDAKKFECERGQA